MSYTLDPSEYPRTFGRDLWKRHYRWLRQHYHDIHGKPKWIYRYWYRGQRVQLKDFPPGSYLTRTLDCRPYRWMTLLMDIEISTYPGHDIVRHRIVSHDVTRGHTPGEF